jgi:hypothetical protein
MPGRTISRPSSRRATLRKFVPIASLAGRRPSTSLIAGWRWTASPSSHRLEFAVAAMERLVELIEDQKEEADADMLSPLDDLVGELAAEKEAPTRSAARSAPGDS